MKIIIFNILILLMANLAWADEQRFRIEGKTLFYDTDTVVDEGEDIEGEITWEDVEKIETMSFVLVSPSHVIALKVVFILCFNTNIRLVIKFQI